MQPRINISYIKNWALAIIAVASIVYSIVDWSNLHQIKEKLSDIAYMSLAVAATEVLFVVGAIIMLIAIGEQVPELNFRDLAKHAISSKRNIKEVASRAIHSRLFGVGFWMNFIGAVGSSTILLVGIFYTLPYQAWGLAVVVLLDLLVTFAWRIPVQLMRLKR